MTQMTGNLDELRRCLECEGRDEYPAGSSLHQSCTTCEAVTMHEPVAYGNSSSVHYSIEFVEGLQTQRDQLREALREIADGPLDGDYDYAPGISEQLRAQDALRAAES